MGGQDAVQALLEPVVSAAGVDLEDVRISKAGNRRRVCVVIDADGGVDLDTVARVSHDVSEALDGYAALGDTPYVLEVTSPGVDRPLTRPQHWRRARGRLVSCDLRDGGCVSGRIVESDDDRVVLDVEGTSQDLPFDEIVQARVQVEFHRPESSGE